MIRFKPGDIIISLIHSPQLITHPKDQNPLITHFVKGPCLVISCEDNEDSHAINYVLILHEYSRLSWVKAHQFVKFEDVKKHDFYSW